MAIDQNSFKTKDGHVQQFCSTHTIHPLGTCEEFFIALEVKIIRVKNCIFSTCKVYFTAKNKPITVSSYTELFAGHNTKENQENHKFYYQ